MNTTLHHKKAQGAFLKQFDGLALAKSLLTTDSLLVGGSSARIDENSREHNMTNKPTAYNINEVTKIGNDFSSSDHNSSAKTFITAGGAIQLLKNLERLRDAIAGYVQKDDTSNHQDHIKTVPTFFKPKLESAELSESTRETFSRIGERARQEFIKEQISRAFQYNIPVSLDNVNFIKLSEEIDRYEFLLEEAKELGFYWDTTNYDPLALEQEISDHKEAQYHEREYMHNDYLSARRVAL